MMMLAEGAVFVFMKYLQLLLWIFLPAMAIAMLVTTISHYRRKRKLKTKDKQDGAVLQFPEKDFFENGSYTAELMHQLSYSNAKCIALQKDFETLEGKYKALLRNINNISATSKQDSMEKIQQELQDTLQEQINSIKRQHELEKKELQAQVEELNLLLKNIESDNISLKEQLTVYSNDNNETAAIFQKWENEKNELKYKISEQEYLKDLVEEKKRQIDFLQQQLEQRIKNHHQVEHQFRDLGVKFMELHERMEGREELDRQSRAWIETKEAEVRSLQEIIMAKSDQTKQLEGTIAELEDKNATITSTMESKEQSIIDLGQQIEKNMEEKNQLEQKVERSQQVLRGFQRKLADILDDEPDEMKECIESPVIVMKPVYQKTNGEEQITESAIQ